MDFNINLVLVVNLVKETIPKAKKSNRLNTQINAQHTNSVKTVPRKPSKIRSRKKPKIIVGIVVKKAVSINLKYVGFWAQFLFISHRFNIEVKPNTKENPTISAYTPITDGKSQMESNIRILLIT